MLPDRLWNDKSTAEGISVLSAKSKIRRTRLSYDLPSQLQKVVPTCAQQCLANYIAQEYSNCQRNDLTCLCRGYSSQGYALGELAYICLEQDCGAASSSQSSAQYYICAAQTGAVSGTHSTLTIPTTVPAPSVSSAASTDAPVPIVWTPTSQFTSSSRPTGLSSATGVRTTVTPSPDHSSVSGPQKSSVSRSASASSSVSAAATSTSTAASSGAPGLSVGGAVGISLAAMVVVALSVGLAYFFTCFRRRRSKYQDEKSSYDFIDDAPSGAAMRQAGGNSKKPNSDNQQYQSPHDLFQHWGNQENDISPQSQASYESLRSVSNLLPSKPKPTQPRQPLKIMLRQPSSDTAATIFAGDQAPRIQSVNMFAADQAPRIPTPSFPSPRFPSPKFPGMAAGLPAHPRVANNSPDRQPQPAQLSRPNAGLPQDPRPPRAAQLARPNGGLPQEPRQPQPTQAPNQIVGLPQDPRNRNLQLAIPPQARSPVLAPPAVLPLLPHPRDKQVQIQQPMITAHSNCSAENDVLEYYASPEAGSFQEFNSPTPVEVEIPKRKAAPTPITVTKATYPPIAVRKDSAGSDTSFESGDDEPTPPEDEKPLTPVEESPIQLESPISGIRYPKIPRSANQTVPRSPRLSVSPRQAMRPEVKRRVGPQKQQTIRVVQNAAPPPLLRNNANTSLAAKRRGDNAAHDLELGLHIPGTPHAKTTDSPHQLSSKLESERPGRSPRRDQRVPNGPREPRNDAALRGDGRAVNRKPSFSQPGFEGRYPAPRVLQNAGPPPNRQIEEPLKSPQWEPKLTPSRRGDDLYLQVGIATPTTTHFTPMNTNFHR